MKKKSLVMLGLVAGLSVLSAVPAFAVGWQSDANGWWYSETDDNMYWYKSGWAWIDGDGNGVAEKYYFDDNGYLLINTTTNDGNYVNASGAWTVDGVVQVRTEANKDIFDGMLVRKMGSQEQVFDYNKDGKLTGQEYFFYMEVERGWEIGFVREGDSYNASSEEYANVPDEQIDLEKLQKEIDDWTNKEADEFIRGVF